MSKLSVMVFIATVLVASVVVVTIPAANALTTRDFSSFDDRHLTARLGNHMVCGDHICAPGEWDKLISSLSAAQRGEQFGRNATETTSPGISATPPPPSPTMPTGVTPKVCETLKGMLSSAGVSSSIISKALADLGCS